MVPDEPARHTCLSGDFPDGGAFDTLLAKDPDGGVPERRARAVRSAETGSPSFAPDMVTSSGGLADYTWIIGSYTNV